MFLHSVVFDGFLMYHPLIIQNFKIASHLRALNKQYDDALRSTTIAFKAALEENNKVLLASIKEQVKKVRTASIHLMY